MKICCVTPCWNAGASIENTMLCILSQTIFLKGAVELHYVICDGGSVDDTLEIIERVADRYAEFGNLTFDYVSEKDNGMYDALAKGFRKIRDGDIFFYLNAGDHLSPFAFEIVSDVMLRHDVQFLTGFDCVFNSLGHLIDVKLPYRYPSQLIQRGAFGKIIPHIQQESTFWSADAHASIDLDRLSQFKFAGDFFIWMSLSRVARLEIIYAFLGGFTLHPGQRSELHRDEYDEELRRIAKPLGIRSLLHAVALRALFLAPRSAKILLNKGIFVFQEASGRYVRSRR